MLSAQKAAHRTLVEEVRALAKQLTQQELLAPRLRRRLLILSLLIAYLEERSVLLPADFDKAREGASRFFEVLGDGAALVRLLEALERSEEHTSELQSLMRISYAVFCLKKK